MTPPAPPAPPPPRTPPAPPTPPSSPSPTSQSSSDSSQRNVTVQLNGEARSTQAATVAQLVQELGLDPAKVAVERNGEIAARSTLSALPLCDGDQLEIVHFVGGGDCGRDSRRDSLSDSRSVSCGDSRGDSCAFHGIRQ